MSAYECCECGNAMSWQQWADLKAKMAAYGCPVPDETDPVCEDCLDRMGEEIEAMMEVVEWATRNVGVN